MAASSRNRILALGGISAVVVAALGGPVVARTIADYARNSDKVDGRHAVGAAIARSERAGKLVATNRRGRLPNDIIRKAPAAADADRLRGRGPAAFVLGCEAGALRGQAFVPADVGSQFEPVTGFGTTFGGPVNPEGTYCHVGEAAARRVATGTYDVRLAIVVWQCETEMRPDIIAAVVTVRSSEPLLATYEPVCQANNVYLRVHIADTTGAPRDASFTAALLDENGIPIP